MRFQFKNFLPEKFSDYVQPELTCLIEKCHLTVQPAVKKYICRRLIICHNLVRRVKYSPDIANISFCHHHIGPV